MNDRIIQLHKINEKLDTVCLDYGDDDDEEQKRSLLGPAALVGAGAGGVLGHQYVQNTGGYASALDRLKGNSMVQNTGSALQKILAKIRGVAKPAVAALSSRHGKLVMLNSKLDAVVELDEEPYKRRVGQRAFLGNQGTILIHGKKGERLSGAAEGWWNQQKNTVGGAAAGLAGGAAAGGALGVGKALRKSGMRSLGSGRAAHYAGVGAAVAGAAGAYAGTVAGSIRGTYGKKGTEIYRRRTGQ